MTTALPAAGKPSWEHRRRLRSETISAAVRHGASNVPAYGSVVHGTSGPGSDIDLLVDTLPGTSLLDPAARFWRWGAG